METPLFGTDGIRTRVGNYPLTHDTLPLLGSAIGQFALRKYGNDAKILIAHDTRQSCAYIKAQLKAGMLRFPITTYDAGVLPTPAAHKIIHSTQAFDCAVIISASHNAYHDNGIKIIDRITGKISAQDEELIKFYLHQDIEVSYDHLGSDIHYPKAQQKYIQYMLNAFSPGCLTGISVVLDCGHGATSHIASEIFEQLGAHTITINDTPNGYNINERAGALHPEHLQKIVQEFGADIGFAFDGDGDRVTVVTRSGGLRNGDEVLALLLDHPAYQQQNVVVSTIMANQGFEVFVQECEKLLIRTPVGDKHVTQAMLQHGSLLGGEPSGHIILRDFVPSSDGIFAALRILETMLYTKNNELETFKSFPQALINITVPHKEDLTKEPFANFIKTAHDQLLRGRIIIRYSGTEPLLRILVEDTDYENAYHIGKSLAHDIQNTFASL
ncbi:phosphoglucosamine mutase [Candidatus Dependentiae bacterium]|nr:phosphoglucosamine mutase [Candidatus Dependentiae bacterium]